jgi:hypothetical protein
VVVTFFGLALSMIGTQSSLSAQLSELKKEHLLPYSQVDLVFASDHTQLDESFTFTRNTLGLLPAINPDPIKDLVTKGIRIVPDLLKELYNQMPSQIVIGHAFIHRRFDSTVPDPIQTAPLFPDENSAFDSHTLTIGDLAYFVLGQIVNRRFNSVDALRGNWPVFSGPSSYATLAHKARKEWSGLTAGRLKASLIQDVKRPAVLWRDVGAIRRLLKWYPGAYLSKVIKARLSTRIILADTDEIAFKPGYTNPVIWRPDFMCPLQHLMFVRATADFRDASVDKVLSEQLSKLDRARELDPREDQMAISIIARIGKRPKSVYLDQCIRFCAKRIKNGVYSVHYKDALTHLRSISES